MVHLEYELLIVSSNDKIRPSSRISLNYSFTYLLPPYTPVKKYQIIFDDVYLP